MPLLYNKKSFKKSLDFIDYIDYNTIKKGVIGMKRVSLKRLFELAKNISSVSDYKITILARRDSIDKSALVNGERKEFKSNKELYNYLLSLV